VNLAEKENRQRVVRSMGLLVFNEAKEKATHLRRNSEISSIGAELQNLLKLFEYIMDYPGPAPAIKRRTAQHKQTLSIIY